VKVLFSSTPGDGHINPLLPTASSLTADGHHVAFATSTGHASKLRKRGFTWFDCGPDNDTLTSRLMTHVSGAGGLPALTSPEYFPWVISRRYAMGDAPDRVEDLTGIVGSWHPDLLIFESCDLATPIVSAAADIPAVHHSFGRAFESRCYDESMPYLEPLWERVGAVPPPLCGMYEDKTFLDICPRAIQSSGVPSSAISLAMSPAGATPLDPAPQWLTQLPDRQSVYVTLGTVMNQAPAVFRAVIDGATQWPVNVVGTTGPDLDPAVLGAVPPAVRLTPYLAQADVLPHCTAVISHAGAGTMLGALCYGLPQLCLPQSTDQPFNAAALLPTRAALTLAPEQVTADAVARAVGDLLHEPAFRAAAQRLRTEIERMPGAGTVLEQLVADRTVS